MRDGGQDDVRDIAGEQDCGEQDGGGGQNGVRAGDGGQDGVKDVAGEQDCREQDGGGG